MDAPGELDEEGWSNPGSRWHSAGLLTSGLGVLLFLMILGAAIFNAKRFVLGKLNRSG